MATALSADLLKRIQGATSTRTVDDSGTTQTFGYLSEGGYNYQIMNGSDRIAVYKDYGPNGSAPVGDPLMFYNGDGSFSHEGAIRDVKFGADLVKFGLAAGAMAFGIPAVMGTGAGGAGAAGAAVTGAEAAGAAAGTVGTASGSILPASATAGAGVSASSAAAGGAGLGIGGVSLGVGDGLAAAGLASSLAQGNAAKNAAEGAASQAAEQQRRAEAAAAATRAEAAANATKAEAERKAAADKAMRDAALTSAFLKKARAKNSLFTGGGSLLGETMGTT